MPLSPRASPPTVTISALLTFCLASSGSLEPRMARAQPLPWQMALAPGLSRAFSATVRAVRPSVVRIDRGPDPIPIRHQGASAPESPSRSENPFRSRQLSRNGSGVIIDARGLVVTNGHVVRGATVVRVGLHDDRVLRAVVLGEDRRSDVALLQIEPAPADLVVASWGDSDSTEIGEWVLAIGSPLGLDQLVTVGVLGRRGVAGREMGLRGDRIREYLQTELAVQDPGRRPVLLAQAEDHARMLRRGECPTMTDETVKNSETEDWRSVDR